MPDEHLALLQGSEFDFLTEVLDRAAANNPAPTVSIIFCQYNRIPIES